MRIRTISTGQLRRMGDQEGLVLRGCGGDPQEWVDGINEILAKEAEYEDLTRNLGGCYVDYMTGEYIINPLEPKVWSVDAEEPDTDGESPEAFRKVTRLSQHIAFLKDFFRSYKDFTDAQVDTMEILLEKLYAQRGITDSTDFSALSPIHYPVMAEFYWLCQKEYLEYDPGEKHLYTQEMLREICLGIHSMCVGSESRYFNGHTNIVDDKFLCFGVKGLMETNKRLKDAILFNILSYMSNRLIGIGDSVAAIDELYLFLTNQTAIEYIRNSMKRVRKKDSCVVLASQNIEDFLIPSIREFTKPMFSIPTHQFLFYPGAINPKDYMVCRISALTRCIARQRKKAPSPPCRRFRDLLCGIRDISASTSATAMPLKPWEPATVW